MTAGVCPFCRVEAQRVFHEGTLVRGIWDGYPVNPGHALLITRRHVETWFDATDDERAELIAAVGIARVEMVSRYQPHGFNIGVNIGPAGGQTVPHLHVHLIPRYRGDVDDPRGGVRNVVPSRGNYLIAPGGASLLADLAGGGILVRGEDDPLLPHLRDQLAETETADLAVAFVLMGGVSALEAHFLDLLRRGGRLRLITGDYMDATDPDALMRLVDLAETHADQVQLRVFESNTTSFHPKAYIFQGSGPEGAAFVGSSNLSTTALTDGVEWNYRIVHARDRLGFRAVCDAFERLLRHPRTSALDTNWVERYRARRRPPAAVALPIRPEPIAPPVQPHKIQAEALSALAQTRKEGNRAGLVVLATGLGKTWLAAFDAGQAKASRVLFLAHREEILDQALATFRRIRPSARLGRYSGAEKSAHADVLFASVQTLGRADHLSRFARDAFDYVVIDEFHRAAAPFYRGLIDYFDPRFLLGLTATPERTDGGDLLALCGENLVYRCDLVRGIREGLLSPFRYFGVPDDVDYSNIPWRSSRFDEESLTAALATQERARNALQQYRARAGRRTLAFCCSKAHADFMAEFFRAEGILAAAVHSGSTSAPRARSLEQLEAGELGVVCCIDMFNEGVDLPHVDTVMMLRPTESRILWLQQFGRGLRTAAGKERLTVIDYIGNHRTFLLKPQTLLGLGSSHAELSQALSRLEVGQLDLPPGCEVTYDLEAINVLRGLLKLEEDAAVREWYEVWRGSNNARPTASEAYHEGWSISAVWKSRGSWLGFVESMGGLSDAEKAVLQDPACGAFLKALERTSMTKSYKMVLLLAALREDSVPGEIEINRLTDAFARIAERSATLRADISVALGDRRALRELIVKNPIAAWTGEGAAHGEPLFSFDKGVFRSRFTADSARRPALRGLARELAEWRLAAYLDRLRSEITCRVSHNRGATPIVFLSERRAELPTGWTPLSIDGETYEGNFVKVALNVVRRRGQQENVLARILRGWFGTRAGAKGTAFMVTFTLKDGQWAMAPVRREGRD